MTDEVLGSGIGAVFPFRSTTDRNAYIAVIEATTGIKPIARRDDEQVRRAIYAPAKTRVILNGSSVKVLARLGYPVVAMTLEVDDPHRAAESALEVFRENGFDPEMVDCGDVELGIPRSFMYFVLLGPDYVPILFWPKNPDPVLIAQITPAEAWT